jgi:hypothetical protein
VSNFRKLVARLRSHLWLGLEEEETTNPADVFRSYDQALLRVQTLFDDRIIDEAILLCRHIFDTENARRDSIDNRSGILLQATGVTATLVIAFLGILATQVREPFSLAVVGLGASFILLYLGRAAVESLRVLGKATRHVIGPTEVIPSEWPDEAVIYRQHCIQTYLAITVENYRVNNRMMERLAVAQHSYRNAVIILLGGGAVSLSSELALRRLLSP